MSANNFIFLKPQLAEVKAGSDTTSEVSSYGSYGSNEDLQKIAVILGLGSAEEVYQERFRIDRRRLEAMMTEDLEENKTATYFFRKVMDSTKTVINWPTRLKIGARSKKDPHVRVSGKMDNVKAARERIMQLLDTKSNRVTMKLDVSYTDHSHIIGKGGLTIKRVMEETGCHIHFPDSNRSNAIEKSNQVSIAGEMENVEMARARVRALTPLIFSFELPVVTTGQDMPDTSSPYVVRIQEQYKVQVMMKNRPKLHGTLVLVKGLQWDVNAAMEATQLLIKYMCGPLADQTPVHMSLEISPMHHSVILGHNGVQLKVIMKNTNTHIIFPDSADPNVPVIKKSNVTITGNLNDVHLATHQLIGCLPLIITFDISEEEEGFNPDTVNGLMEQHNVYINVRRKPKQMLLSVVIKGVERQADDIYEARRQLLQCKELTVKADIPDSYKIPEQILNCVNASLFNPFSPSHNNNLPQSPMTLPQPQQALSVNQNPYPLAPLRFNDIACYQSLGSPIFNQGPGGYPIPLSPIGPLTPPIYPSWGIIPPSPQATPPANVFQFMNPMQAGGSMISDNITMWDASHVQPQQVTQQHLLLPQYQGQQSAQVPSSVSGNQLQPNPYYQNTQSNFLLNTSSQMSSGYQSNFTGSTASLETNSLSAGSNNGMSPSGSPISKGQSPNTSPLPPDTTGNDLVKIFTELSASDRRAPGIEKKTIENIQKQFSPDNYQKMKNQAQQVMRDGVNGGFRVPTSRWSGYGFSHTSPSGWNLHGEQNQLVQTPPSNGATVENNDDFDTPKAKNSPPHCESPLSPILRTTPISKPCKFEQLDVLLKDIGLAKYVDIFRMHEIDVSTFASLTESDLIEIGITALGARKKMMSTIAELQKLQTDANGSILKSVNKLHSNMSSPNPTLKEDD